MKHTPGEWKQTIYDHGGSRIWVEDGDGRRNLIADTYEPIGNACLMYAAPDLLAACKKFVKESQSSDPADWMEALEQTEAAIAKAEP